MQLSIYSFFSGAGFLDLGFEDENFNIRFVNEFSNSFLSVYKYSREKMGYSTPTYGYFADDINELFKEPNSTKMKENISNDKLVSLVGFIGGPPCPDFSIAGKNRGVEGENGKLTYSYKDLILKHEPDFFLFENVKGLWKTKKHREVYDGIKKSFIEKGYVLTDKLINSLEYGVPQDRERILLFGVKFNLLEDSNENAQKLLNEKFSWGNTAYKTSEIKTINWPTTDTFEIDGYKEPPKEIVKELTIEYWFNKNNVYEHPNSSDYFKPKSIDRFENIIEGDVSKKSFKRLHRWRFSPTVAYGNNEVHLHPYKARRLSVSEALAIQSLPKEYEILPELTLSNKFKTIGNGVPYLVSKGVAHQIKMFLENNCFENRGD